MATLPQQGTGRHGRGPHRDITRLHDDATSSTSGWTPTGGDQYELALGNLGEATVGTVVFAVVVDGVASETGTKITNTATITDDGSQGADATPTNNSATVETSLAHVTEVDL